MFVKYPFYLSFVCSSVLWSAAMPVSLDHNNFRMTYESLTLPGDEAMGLVGLNYQQMFGSYWYGGVGVYGAAAGERGGFFTGGFEGGVRYPLIGGLEAQGGLFVGGGGGGSAPQGGGLMVRSHVGMTYGNDTLRGGVQLSRIEFPDGEIKSTQIAAVIDLPFESFRLDSRYRGNLDYLPYDVESFFQRSMKPNQGQFGVEVQRYTPTSSARQTDGSLLSVPFDTVGIRYENLLSRNFLWNVTTAGAMRGGADGYAEIFSGIGWRYGVFDTLHTKSRLFVTAEGALGMAGGGQVATGGGTMGKVSAGLSYQLSPEWSVDARSGYVRSVDGDFSARLMNFSLKHSFVTFSPSMEGSKNGVYSEGLIRRNWMIRPVHETYLSAKRKNIESGAVSLVGMQMDVVSSGNGYVYGKALGAYSGGAGGYASGTLGAGVSYPLPLNVPVHLYAQAGVGAAGGGGIDVGSGTIVEAEGGMMVRIAPNTDFWLGAGMTRSIDGALDTPMVNVGVAYRFGTIGHRRQLY